jgi:NDP-sugar pyrophosphorylase family protein
VTAVNLALPKKAMLLAAGEGMRLRPLTNTMPKCMVPIDGAPILEHNIRWLRRFGVTELIINLHYMPQAVRDYFGDGSRWGVNITYSLEASLLGTAGGVKHVEWFFDAPFFLWYGDNMSTCNLERLFTFHQAQAALATIALFHREDVTASGIVGLDGNGRITRFLEKPRPEQIFSHWVNAGIYVLEPQILEMIPSGIVSDFSHDIFPALLAGGEALYGYRLSEEEGLWWIDTPFDLQRMQTEFTQRSMAS